MNIIAYCRQVYQARQHEEAKFQVKVELMYSCAVGGKIADTKLRGGTFQKSASSLLVGTKFVQNTDVTAFA